MSGINGLWKIVKSMIPPEKMRGAARNVVESIIERKKDYPQQDNEVQTIIFFFEQKGKSYFSVGFVNEQNQIVRQESVQTTDEMIEKFLDNI